MNKKCEMCEDSKDIDTTIGYTRLRIYIDTEGKKKTMNIKIGEMLCVTKPIKINYCFECGRKL